MTDDYSAAKARLSECEELGRPFVLITASTDSKDRVDEFTLNSRADQGIVNILLAWGLHYVFDGAEEASLYLMALHMRNAFKQDLENGPH